MNAADAEPIDAMLESDLDEVLAIERESYPTPWSRESFLHDLKDNPFGWNLVLREDARVIAYACLWIVDNRLMINNIAVISERRGQGLGRVWLQAILTEAADRGCREATLEVRPSNLRARRLYERAGFVATGARRDYYQDTHEDAIVMTKTLP